ncbi:bifunctional tetrahydrofolate synthase/dihydrofolate synthase [Ferrimonas gelatinilytica]|uniref:Dihydrofolate synthase/folylpolyglutamate synthase n=1 Tax=Ferrimonas gelatinilytica TaxID=1255257 RepID=A0ABP9S4H3_9GAMM
MTPGLDASDSLAVWLEKILQLHPSEIDLGLTRLRRVAMRMGLTALPDSQVITVAGTNGKGTTCALMEQILMADGHRVGVFSSPHIERYNERVRIDGQELPDQDHVDAFTAIAAAQQDTSLTFFEYSALAALWLFARERPDVVLLEVGLGGRLDATNLIDADIAVITTVDLDHQEYLGDTREKVGREKAGIMRAGRPVICGDPNPPESVATCAAELGAILLQRGEAFELVADHDQWTYQSPGYRFGALPLPAIPLDNAATAITALRQLEGGVSETAIRRGLSQVRVPGRLEVLSHAPDLVLDVAHNPQAGAYLAQWLKRQSYDGIHAVCGMLADKDVKATLAPLGELPLRWYLADLNVPRGAPASRLLFALNDAPGPVATPQCFDSVSAALSEALSRARHGELVILFGSFYTVAEAKAYWRTRS